MRLSISTCRGWILAAVVLTAVGLPGARVALAQDAPTIDIQPDNAEACDGGAATFTVVASGTPPLEYLWYEDGVAIWGAFGASYTIDPVGPGAEGLFHVIVSNLYGSVQSNVVTLTVYEGPGITVHPQGTAVCEDESLTLWVIADGLGTLEYQWRKGGVDLTGEESNTLVIDPVTTGDAGDYDVVVSDDCGSVTSIAATVSVRVGPSILTDPDDDFACVGQPAPVEFEVVADGSTPLSYQWYHNGAPISGATAAIYSDDDVTMGDAGEYYVIVSNDCDVDGVQSDTATLTVNIGPTINGHPQHQVACHFAERYLP